MLGTLVLANFIEFKFYAVLFIFTLDIGFWLLAIYHVPHEGMNDKL